MASRSNHRKDDSLSAAQDPTKSPLFSRIFYEKGASVNRMVATHIGMSAWNSALGDQLAAHLWQNPTVEDLMRSLNPFFEGTLTAMDAMLPWLRRPGFPVVTLSTDSGNLVVSQKPISPYLPPLGQGESENWWIPMHVSYSSTASPHKFAFSSKSMTVPLPENHLVGEPDSFVVGDPTFLGFYIVRYNNSADWANRIKVAVTDLADRPDYTRALAFQVAILVRMSHERLDLLTQLVAALNGPLANNPKFGGYDGSGDLYTLLATNTAPIVSVANAGGVGGQLSAALADLMGSVATRLGWTSTEMAVNSSTSRNDASPASPPWPQREDSKVEIRGRNDLRPTALLTAVQYGHAQTISTALNMLRNSPSSVSGPGSRAVYFSAVRHGNQADYAAVNKLLSEAIAHNSSDEALDILFGLTSGASTSDGCTNGLSRLFDVLRAGVIQTLDVVTTLGDMIACAPICRPAALISLDPQAKQLWKDQGAAATATITAGLATLTQEIELNIVSELLASQGPEIVSPEEKVAAETLIKINMAMVAANKA